MSAIVLGTKIGRTSNSVEGPGLSPSSIRFRRPDGYEAGPSRRHSNHTSVQLSQFEGSSLRAQVRNSLTEEFGIDEEAGHQGPCDEERSAYRHRKKPGCS